MSKVILAHAPDGVALADSIRALLRAEPVSIETITGRPPDPWEVVVILFVLTPGALRDAGLLDYARQAVALDLPSYRLSKISPPTASTRSRTRSRCSAPGMRRAFSRATARVCWNQLSGS